MTEAEEKRMAKLEMALTAIQLWAESFTVELCPEPDLKKAQALLEAGGMTLGSINAHNYSVILKGVAEQTKEELRK